MDGIKGHNMGIGKKIFKNVVEDVGKEVGQDTPGAIKKCVDAVFDDDIDDVGKYIMDNVVKPNVKKGIFTCVQVVLKSVSDSVGGTIGYVGNKVLDATEKELFGSVDPNRRKGTVVGDNPSYKNYSGSYKRSESPKGSSTSSSNHNTSADNNNLRSSRNPDVVYFDTQQAANDCLWTMNEYIDLYGQVRVSEYYEIADQSNLILTTDHRYGWLNLDNAEVRRAMNMKYYILLPRPRIL